jgi:hypothetical protein
LRRGFTADPTRRRAFRDPAHERTALWKAFWFVFVPAPIILYVIYVALLWAWVIFIPLTPIEYVAGPYSLLAFVLMAAAAVAVWLNSDNSRHHTWSYLARLFVVAYVVWYGFRALPVWRLLLFHSVQAWTAT